MQPEPGSSHWKCVHFFIYDDLLHSDCCSLCSKCPLVAVSYKGLRTPYLWMSSTYRHNPPIGSSTPPRSQFSLSQTSIVGCVIERRFRSSSRTRIMWLSLTPVSRTCLCSIYWNNCPRSYPSCFKLSESTAISCYSTAAVEVCSAGLSAQVAWIMLWNKICLTRTD